MHELPPTSPAALVAAAGIATAAPAGAWIVPTARPEPRWRRVAAAIRRSAAGQPRGR